MLYVRHKPIWPTAKYVCSIGYIQFDAPNTAYNNFGIIIIVSTNLIYN